MKRLRFIHNFVQPTVIAGLVLSLLISSIPSAELIAATQDDRNAAIYDYNYYDPNDYTSCDASSGPANLIGNDNLQKIFNYLLTKGLTEIQAAGALGNIDQESAGGDPTIIQGGGHTDDPSTVKTGGWGIIQWTPGSKIIGLLKQANITTPPQDLATQVDLLWWHMNNTSPTGASNMVANYKTITDLRRAVTDFHDKIEGSADKTMANRYAKAQNLLRLYGGANTATSNVPTAQTSCTGSVNGDVIKTAINYAWPTYHNAPYTTKKPSYATAINAAIKKGKYVGGLQYPGVDCGGFITRVMQDSVDPQYNDTEYKGPTGSPTTGQWGYLKNSGKYVEIFPKTTADMKPGDIAINDHHTYMYVGKNPGFETEIASASVSFTGTGWRAPMAGRETPADPDYHWFRMK